MNTARVILPLLALGIAGGSSLAGAASKLPNFKVERWVNSPPLTVEASRRIRPSSVRATA